MNNNQFRRLVLDTPSAKPPSSSPPSKDASATLSALGSRARSSIPMTPRSISKGSYSSDFARQLAESRRPTDKKFRSSAAPKGSKLAKGYVDRTQLRREQGEEDAGDVEERVKALEDMMKLGQIDAETFQKLRKEITGKDLGGDVESTHLIKGLDWKLLERVKRGEDVLSAPKEDVKEKEEVAEDKEPVVDVDDEFEKLEEKEIVPVAKEAREKKGMMAPPAAVAGKKRTRDEILKELKASRAAAAAEVKAAQQPSLGSKFRKIGGRGSEQAKRFVETDEKGRRREVLVTVDEDGRQKRKIRYLADDDKLNDLAMPDKDAQPLGMEVPEYASTKAKVEDAEDDVDIFEGVGADYDPLAGIDDDSSSEDGQRDQDEPVKPTKDHNDEDTGHDRESSASESSPGKALGPTEPQPSKPHNYFGTTSKPEPETPETPFQDPTILAAIKKASALQATSDSTSSPPSSAADAEAILRRKKLLESAAYDRDAQDMDMAFGSSKFGDDEDETFIEGGAKAGRKRGPKKRKGDKDSAGDVLGVLEGRKSKGG
jgi:hypothetical protein